MKVAFAKLLEKDPVQSSHVDFRAGGNGVPILTRASGQSVVGVQTMGLPNGSKPYPGGGANKTVLGAVRMGDQDGNAPGSAIIPGDIFYPPGQPDKFVPERYFSNIGNNVFQPENNDKGTIALLKRLGDQQFKAKSQAPFEDYLVQQRLAKDIEEASRNASLSDLGLSRDILRKLAEERRQLNEEDYLRKMLNAGATPEFAQKEIENVRNANALQEAKQVEDRTYQAKTLIQRMAIQRGITPMVREPLTQSSAITNPQPSQAMSQAMGKPGEGFGSMPLDLNRELLTADFYKKFLKRSRISQEAVDEATAFSNLLLGTSIEDKIPAPSSGSYSLATLKGQERQMQIENASEVLASRLETIRQRGTRIYLPLPKPAVGKKIIDSVYKTKQKTEGSKVVYSPETIEELNPLQLLLSINWNVQDQPNGYNNLRKEVAKYSWGTPEKPSETWLSDFRKVAYSLNKSEQTVRVPFPTLSLPVLTPEYINLFNDIKGKALPELRHDIETGRVTLQTNKVEEEKPVEVPKLAEATTVPVATLNEAVNKMIGEPPKKRKLVRRVVAEPVVSIAEASTTGEDALRPKDALTGKYNEVRLNILTIPELKKILQGQKDIITGRKLTTSKLGKADLVEKIMSGKN